MVPEPGQFDLGGLRGLIKELHPLFWPELACLRGSPPFFGLHKLVLEASNLLLGLQSSSSKVQSSSAGRFSSSPGLISLVRVPIPTAQGLSL